MKDQQQKHSNVASSGNGSHPGQGTQESSFAPGPPGALPMHSIMQQMFANPAMFAQLGYQTQAMYPGPIRDMSSMSRGDHSSSGDSSNKNNGMHQPTPIPSPFHMSAIESIVGAGIGAFSEETPSAFVSSSITNGTFFSGIPSPNSMATAGMTHPAPAEKPMISGSTAIPFHSLSSTAAIQGQSATSVLPRGCRGPRARSKRDADEAFDDDLSDSALSRKGSTRGTLDCDSSFAHKPDRDSNSARARSTHLPKKAYVDKLKELVEGLHAERSEESKIRRVAIQHLAEVQAVRRAVLKTFLKFHAGFESSPRKWTTIIEDNFFLKQPVTPYRSFPRAEIEQECRKSKGVDAIISDAASMSVMIEGIGSRSARWMQIKKDQFLAREEVKTSSLVQCKSRRILRRDSRLQQTLSSLSSSLDSSAENGSGGDEGSNESHTRNELLVAEEGPEEKTAMPLSLFDGTSTKQSHSNRNDFGSEFSNDKQQDSPNDFHDYHAKPLPDPKLCSSTTSSDSLTDSQNQPAHAPVGNNEKPVCTDTSSCDEDKPQSSPTEKESTAAFSPPPINFGSTGETVGVAISSSSSAGIRKESEKSSDECASVTSKTKSSTDSASACVSSSAVQRTGLPLNIARSGGISHSIRPVLTPDKFGQRCGQRGSNPRLDTAPAISLPPFLGIGMRSSANSPLGTVFTKKSADMTCATRRSSKRSEMNGFVPTVDSSATFPSRDSLLKATRMETELSSDSASKLAIVSNDNDTDVSELSNTPPKIQAHYFINEDDMLLSDDVLMCPFVFRSQGAVHCGALAECVMLGMIRAHYSPRNKLLNMEMIYDAMGFMQQLERASSNEGAAQIVPNSLEMSLSPKTDEARVITLAKSPFLVVSVNEAWTRITKYTQMDVEGKELSILNGERTDLDAGNRSGKPSHDFAEVAKKRPACSVNTYYDKYGRDFVSFICSYPLTNANDEATHILHVWRELPSSDCLSES